MTLVVEDGTGLSTAEAYVSVADAITYLSKFSSTPAAWSSSSETAKENALREAARYLDAVYGNRWLGSRRILEQALDWPRVDIVDRDGFYVDSESIPDAIKNANAYLAAVAVSSTLLPDQSNTGVIARKKIKVGPIEKDVQYEGGSGSGATSQMEFPIVDRMLRHLTLVAGELRRA